ncbi:putative alcohol oxidase [Lyophyllum shimeji]|uniref:Alcohol oxidase n=1 Tax=Lyophyllum shimeji TaxID=47721 RepID=A0A9P3UIT0_LYOSH|nr:putative alcohol oxidase [Lyophyllum shimeji]
MLDRPYDFFVRYHWTWDGEAELPITSSHITLTYSLLKQGVALGFGALCSPGVYGIHITTDASAVANRTFSYVIVGGGTAGLTVASRLAENPAISVLVIEAGPDAQNDTLVNDPGQSITVPYVYDWKYNTTAQTAGGSILAMTQGKVLGGSSSINGMCWTRATIDQYDSLERLGNPGWNFKSLLSYMKKAEYYHLPSPEQVSLGATVIPSVHGYEGDVNAGFPQPYEATVAAGKLVTAAMAAIPGLAHNLDVASGVPNGAARFQYSIKPGNNTVISPNGNTRSSSANAHIYPSLQNKPNLIILTEHQATSLVWAEGSQPLSKASGVKFIQAPIPNAVPGPEFAVGIEKEAIVAAGAIGSPRFLELSGVGDSRVLQNVGIPVKIDLPAVGTNLQDQALNTVVYGVPADTPTSEYTAVNAPFTPAVAFVDVEQMLGVDAARTAGKELRKSIPTRADDIVASGAFTSKQGLIKILQIQAESIFDYKAPVVEYSFAVSQPALGSQLIGAAIWNLIPQWRGTVHIQSSNPTVHPEIDPRFFTGSDIDLYIKGNASQLGRKIFNTSPLKEYTVGEIMPGVAAVPDGASDTQWQDNVISTYNAVLHPIGTVAMLPRENGGAVGPDLVVYGTSNVRVVDSSIIPIQLSAHLSSSVYGIAEKAADMIKSSAGQ